MATFHKFALSDSFPTVTVSEIRPSSVVCDVLSKSFWTLPAGVVITGKVTAVTSQTGAYKLRQFTEPISRHVTSTVQKLIKGMQRTGLNRHMRCYVTKDRVRRHVPFLLPGPLGLPRSQFLKLASYHRLCHHQYFHH